MENSFQEHHIVLVKEDAVFTTHWPLGRVISTFPGKDGRVCVAMVCTPTGTYKRPIAKLVLVGISSMPPLWCNNK